MSKILITGGHLTPALAFIDYCQAHSVDFEFVFAGRKFAQLDNQQESWEKSEVEKRHIRFIDFFAVKTGNFSCRDFFFSFSQAVAILKKEKIDLVLSFGGYLALPFALAANDKKIPVVTHEQTCVLGRANRLIAALSKYLAVSFPHTTMLFARKTVVTGNPLRSALFESQKAPPTWLKTKSDLPILYISGGSQGCKIINDTLRPLLPTLSQKYLIIHQVGRSSSRRQPLAEITTWLQTSAGQKVNQANYFPREFFSASDLAYIYPRARLALARAGANTVAELSAFAVPTLYIPLPFANYQEQAKNAHFLVTQNAAMVLPQKKLNQANLLSALQDLDDQSQTLRANLLPLASANQDAAQKLFALVKRAIKSN